MDKSLIDAIQLMAEGKEEGFNKVYSETYNHVYFRAKSYMKNEEDVLDLVQIVYVEAYRSIGSLQTPEALFGWLDGITYRQGMKQYRKKKDVLLSEEGEGIFETIETEDISSMPELTADQKETSKIIRELIEELPVLQKIAMIAYYFDNLSVGQIAEIQECSEGTVKSRLNYGRKYLKDRIEEKEKKEGYRLHVFAVPTLYFAIKMLEGETTMTVQAAQGVYNATCIATGLTAGTITSATVAASAATGSTQAVAAVEVGKAAGIGAKFASLSTGMKVVVIASTLAVGTVTVGGVAYVATNQAAMTDIVTAEVEEIDRKKVDFPSGDVTGFISMNKVSEDEELLEAIFSPTRTDEFEYTFYSFDIEKFFEKGELIGCEIWDDMPKDFYVSSITFLHSVTGEMTTVKYNENDMVEAVYFRGDPSADVVVTVAQRNSVEKNIEENVEENVTENVIETQVNAEENQIVELSEIEKIQIADAIAYFGCMSYQFEPTSYVSTVRAYIQTILKGDGEGALPLGWSSDTVTEETVKEFYEAGFGIMLPADYTYNDYGVTCNSELEWEAGADYFKYRSLDVEDTGDGTYILKGTFLWGAEGEEDLYSFEATAIESGNEDVFGGLTLTAYAVNE